ncbi:MAG: hypothetical protein J6R82_02525 [Clostridia bacterium]|nr:hypothetical protein [Clostridia bacterium]
MTVLNKIRAIATAVLFCGLIVFFGVATLLSPDQEYSAYERRPLRQAPVYEEAESLSAYFADWETYLTDQFYLRDALRFLKSGFAHNILRQKDVNGYYSENGSQAEILYPMHSETILQNAKLLENLRQTHFANSPAYFAVIPDKSYYMDASLGLDYQKIDAIFAENLHATSIPLYDTLDLSDYYHTDIHWKQEKLDDVYGALRSKMGNHLPPFAENGYTTKSAGKFYGVLYGQAAMPAERDEMHYLRNSTIDGLKLKVIDTGKEGSIYDTEGFAGDDPYDLYLGGESAILHIQNPAAENQNGKKLILFRDSFGRSIAPLLAEGYSEIVLIDLRWIRPAFLASFPDLIAADENTDILFLYSAQVLNSMKLG